MWTSARHPVRIGTVTKSDTIHFDNSILDGKSQMMRSILFASVAFVLVGGVVQAQQGKPRNPEKLEKCRQLATDRGFSSASGRAKGQGRAKKEFVRACMHGKQS